MKWLEHVPALITRLGAAPLVKTVRHLMVTATVMLTAIRLKTAVKMYTALLVICKALLKIQLAVSTYTIVCSIIDPRRCTDIGITTCCTDATNTGLCDVHYRDNQNGRCSCNVSCHLRNDCCPDAESIDCIRKFYTQYFWSTPWLLLYKKWFASRNLYWSWKVSRLLHVECQYIMLCPRWRMLLWQFLHNV